MTKTYQNYCVKFIKNKINLTDNFVYIRYLL